VPFSPDQIIGEKYQLKRHLARGGMGAVWRAHHLDLGIDVAIKVLRSDVVGDEMAAARFRREARAAAQLKSPHVVHVHDYGVHGDVPYLVMELLEGEDLDEYLEREGPLPLEQAVSLIEEACEGLTLVHERASFIATSSRAISFSLARVPRC
jgi:serine/threonine-protein kinase